MSNNSNTGVKLSKYVTGGSHSRIRAILRNGTMVEGLLRKNPSLEHYPYIFSDGANGEDRRYSENGSFWDTPNPLDITLLSQINEPILYRNRGELELKISELRAELNRCEKYLEKLKSRKVRVGEELEDGSIMLMKDLKMALVVSPEFSGSWNDSFDILRKHGPQWWLPTIDQLTMARRTLPEIFAPDKFFWSCEGPANSSYSYISVASGRSTQDKSAPHLIRGFRCITFNPR